MTVSEGIGVGLLLNGQLFHGSDALAGGFGHVTIGREAEGQSRLPLPRRSEDRPSTITIDAVGNPWLAESLIDKVANLKLR